MTHYVGAVRPGSIAGDCGLQREHVAQSDRLTMHQTALNHCAEVYFEAPIMNIPGNPGLGLQLDVFTRMNGTEDGTVENGM